MGCLGHMGIFSFPAEPPSRMIALFNMSVTERARGAIQNGYIQFRALLIFKKKKKSKKQNHQAQTNHPVK